MKSKQAIEGKLSQLSRDVLEELKRKYRTIHANEPQKYPVMDGNDHFSDEFIKFVRYNFPDIVKLHGTKKPKISLYINPELYKRIDNEHPELSMSHQITAMFGQFFSDYGNILDSIPTPQTSNARTTTATVPEVVKQHFLDFVEKRICLSKSEATRFILLHMFLRSKVSSLDPRKEAVGVT